MSRLFPKMTFQQFAGSKHSVAVAAMVVQRFLAVIIPVAVAAVILRCVLDHPHVYYMGTI